ncbi:uncharacterized protein LOC142775806 isoform X4 [Rhipicephalus microplus]|uniref:uncharacterized protein LOC142775806 isoform X4 n=1 Tax=Rhipicephalus microplus TaxID=6941 RepID=UPI003F6A7544
MSTAATRKTVECRSVEGVCKQLEKLPVEKPAACSRERRWSQQLPPGRWRALLGLRGGCNHLMPWCSSHHGVRLLQLPEGLIAPSSKTDRHPSVKYTAASTSQTCHTGMMFGTLVKCQSSAASWPTRQRVRFIFHVNTSQHNGRGTRCVLQRWGNGS